MPAKRIAASICAAVLACASTLSARAADPPPAEVVDAGDSRAVPEAPWNVLEHGGHSLEFHGYYRYGYGWTPSGDAMPSFGAPGAPAKYRLGNENVQGGEVIFDYRYYLDGIPPDSRRNETGSRFIQLQGRWDEFQDIRDLDKLFLEFSNDHTKEAFVRLGNFLGDGTHVWFGRRYYDRQDIHLIDHFWLNAAQGSDYGGGIEGIKLPGGKTVDVAALYAYDEGARQAPLQATGDDIDSYVVDVRLRGYSFGPASTLTLVGQLGYRPKYDAPASVAVAGLTPDDKHGFGLGAYHELTTSSGRDKTGVMFRKGAAMVQSDFNSRAPTELQGYDLDRAWSLEINNDLLVEMAPRWSLQWAAVARYENAGHPGFDPKATGDSILWLSTGVRPLFYLRPKLNVAWESGFDYIDNERIGAKGVLWKNTVALEIQKRPGYFERPVFRVFATYGSWSDDLKGTIATTSEFVNRTTGFVFGLQVETAW